eukprot:6740286-Heterocapsa_arctica.AAC.1
MCSVMRSLKRALKGMDAFALRRRPKGHVAGMAPVYIAAFVVLFGWRDEGLPWRLVEGSEIAGEIAPTNIFRDIERGDQDGEALRSQLLGEAAAHF